jgi:hypothetical protein
MIPLNDTLNGPLSGPPMSESPSYRSAREIG